VARRRLIPARGAASAGALLVVLLAATLALPASALALPDLTPDIPGPSDIAEGIFEFFFETFFGIEAKATRRAVEFLVAQPTYTDAGRYPDLNALRTYVSAGGWGIFTLVFTASALRYWASGFTSSSSYDALEALGRSIVAAGALVVYPAVFEYATVAGNLITHALLNAPGVQDGLTRLLAAALVANFATLGIGSIATVIALIYAPLLMMRQGERNGQTLGKQWLGIRVVRTDGQVLDFWWSALRDVGLKNFGISALSSFTFGIAFFVNYLWPLWDDRNRALHDLVAATLVVRA